VGLGVAARKRTHNKKKKNFKNWGKKHPPMDGGWTEPPNKKRFKDRKGQTYLGGGPQLAGGPKPDVETEGTENCHPQQKDFCWGTQWVFLVPRPKTETKVEEWTGKKGCQ